MNELKLYNWYGETFESILPSSTKNLKAYKKEVKNVFLRSKDSIKANEKVEKDLYVRAKQKLSDNLKRELASHKVAYKNKIAVLKDSIKKLSSFDTMEKLLKFEIGKLKKKKNEVQNYAKDFVYSLIKSADDIDFKIKNISQLQKTTTESETEIFKKFTVYNIILLYIKNNSDRDFDIKKIEHLLLPIELNWLEKSKIATTSYFKDIYYKLENERQKLQLQKDKLVAEYNATYAIQKEIYIREKNNIKLKNKQTILQLEYEYNENLKRKREEAKKVKELSLKKIEEQKEQIISVQAKNNLITHEIISKANNSINRIKEIYKKEKVTQKLRSQIQLYKDLYIYIKSKKISVSPFDFSYNHLTRKELQEKITKLKEYFIVSNFNEQLAIIAIQSFLTSTNIKRTEYEGNLLLKSQYKQKIGTIKKSYSYEGIYNLEEAKALKEKFIDYRITRLKYRYEKIDAKYQLHLLKINNVYQKEKEEFNTKRNEIQKEYQVRISELNQKIKNKDISKQAYKNKVVEYKIYRKEAINEAKLKSKIQSNKEILRSSFWRELSEYKVNLKVYESKINEAQKTIPIETSKNLRYFASILNFIFPGLSELIFFKQFTKGILMSIVSIISIVGIIPFSFGAYWDEMGGIPGFSDLGAGIHNNALGILPDARVYLFGGVISVILMVFVLIYHLVSSLGAYRVAKFLEYGSRPNKWTHTKRWLNSSGFPWMISLVGWMLMIFIVATPVITSILVSFTNYGFEHYAPAQTVEWVGLKQWGKWWTLRENRLFESLQSVILWSIIWTILSTLFPISLGILIAILTNNQRIRFKKIFRLIYILPRAIPAFVTLSFIRSMFIGGDEGLINKILLTIGLVKESRNWLQEIGTARVLVIVVQTWIAYAWIFMLVTGNLQSIPKDIYEAGSVDGAKGRQLFWYLTLPSLLLSIAPMLIGQFVGAFNNFTTISIFTGGGPAFPNPTIFGEGSTDIIISWVFKITTGGIQFPGNQAFAAALTTLAASFSIAVSARGFIKTMSRRD
ncbi:ABC transporter permease subunit [Mycoplasmopsis cynos]|uniref:ABC transporter permease subunit n=1 Tax=Mycoplasmopsis cynos TaxID=171284 RepID=UPI002201C74A|nr:ABC transporter permease subunit [Mycoplasmopsis cynos]UWV86145.1 ABC transporter permease subunit [Mycoplasmopsis cynos]